jgi:hypothetical protein
VKNRDGRREVAIVTGQTGSCDSHWANGKLRSSLGIRNNRILHDMDINTNHSISKLRDP